MVINNRDDVKTVRADYTIRRDHNILLTAHQDKDYRIIFEKGVGGREEVEEELHVFMCAVKMARLVNFISHYVVDIS
jgi:hypothetical protein